VRTEKGTERFLRKRNVMLLVFIFINKYIAVEFIKNIQQDATMYQNLLFHIYMKHNMFRATHRPSSGA